MEHTHESKKESYTYTIIFHLIIILTNMIYHSSANEIGIENNTRLSTDTWLLSHTTTPAQLPILQNEKNIVIKIKPRGTVGYKGLTKKYKNEWESIPSKNSPLFKKNSSYTYPLLHSKNSSYTYPLLLHSISIPILKNNKTSRIGGTDTNNNIPLKYMSNDLSAVDNSPPPHDQVARMARYIVSTSDWLSISTISTKDKINGFPFTNLFSTSDGPKGMSSGNPYMYMTPLDVSARDLQKDSRASVVMSLVQGNYCREQDYDPEDPRCARVILTGNIVKLPVNSTEEQFAKMSLFSRHSEMQDWPKDHGWFFAKMNISNILVLDYFGGIQTVSTDDYFKAA